MPIFKSKKSKDGSLDVQNDLNDLPPVKQLDKRLGLDCYRDFFTLKNYWKTVTRRNKEAEALLMHRQVTHHSLYMYILIKINFNLHL
jgi:hypothetical protein